MKEHPILFSAPMIRALLVDKKTQTRRAMNPQPQKNDIWTGGYVIKSKAINSGVETFNRERGNPLPGDPTPCPYGQPGDRLWVKENFYSDTREPYNGSHLNPAVIYAATPELAKYKLGKGVEVCRFVDGSLPTREQSQKNLDGHRFQRLRPSIFMPRWASRITLEITAIRVERVQEISPEDAIAEGLRSDEFPIGGDHVTKFGLEGWRHMDWRQSPVDAYERLWDSINAKRPGCSWSDNCWVWVLEFRRV